MISITSLQENVIISQNLIKTGITLKLLDAVLEYDKRKMTIHMYLESSSISSINLINQHTVFEKVKNRRRGFGIYDSNFRILA